MSGGRSRIGVLAELSQGLALPTKRPCHSPSYQTLTQPTAPSASPQHLWLCQVRLRLIARAAQRVRKTSNEQKEKASLLLEWCQVCVETLGNEQQPRSHT